jgi:hypothetical protein
MYTAIVNAHILFKEHGMHNKSEKQKMKEPGYHLLDFMHMLMKGFLTENLWGLILSRNEQNLVAQPREENGRFAQSPPLAVQLAVPKEVGVHIIMKKHKQEQGHDNRQRCRVCGIKTNYICMDCEGEPALCSGLKDDGTC